MLLSGCCNVFRFEYVHFSVLLPDITLSILLLGIIVDNANETRTLLINSRISRIVSIVCIVGLYDSYWKFCGGCGRWHHTPWLPGSRSNVVALAQGEVIVVALLRC